MKRKNNNGIFYVVISFVAILGIVSFGAKAYFGEAPKVLVEGNYIEAEQVATEQTLGAVSGPDVYQRMNFHAGYTRGGNVISTTTTATTYTLTDDELGGDTYWINWLPNVSTTVTTMATTSNGFAFMDIPNAGDSREYVLYNASSTAAATITLAAGTGVDLQKNEDTADLATTGGSATKLTFIRKPNTDVMLIMEQFDEAD